MLHLATGLPKSTVVRLTKSLRRKSGSELRFELKRSKQRELSPVLARLLPRTAGTSHQRAVPRMCQRRAAVSLDRGTGGRHLNVIRDLLSRLACPQTDKHLAAPDLNVVFPYDEAYARAGLLAT